MPNERGFVIKIVADLQLPKLSTNRELFHSRIQARLSRPIRSRSRRWCRPAARPCRQVGALDDRIQPPNLSISKTVDEVIVHHADRLHVCINDGRTNEAESPVFEILAKRVGFT